MELLNAVNSILRRQRNSGAPAPLRSCATGALAVQDAHARYQEAMLQGKTYEATTAAAVTIPATFASTSPTFTLYNPVDSGVVAVLWRVVVVPSAIIAAATAMGLVFSPTPAAPSSVTAITVRPTLIGGGPSGKVAAYSAATTVAPVLVRAVPISGGASAASVDPTPVDVELNGDMGLAPGYSISLAALTAVVGLVTMIWEEVEV